MPLALLGVTLLLSIIAKAILTNSFFVNFFTGLFYDMGIAFSHFGFGILMNVVIYVGLLGLIGTGVLFGLRLRKDKKLDTIISHVSLFVSIFFTMMFLGTLLFALSTGSILKNLTDLLLLVAVGIISTIALVLSIINVVKIYLPKKEEEK
jgi:hypothetical protein